MGADDDRPVSNAAPRGAEAPPRVAPSTWVGVALIGAALFGFGIWTPAWRTLPYGLALSYVAAAGGAVLFIAGLTFAESARRRGPATSIEDLPGVEVYRPPRKALVHPAETGPDEDPP
jgi:hypothetical protein